MKYLSLHKHTLIITSLFVFFLFSYTAAQPGAKEELVNIESYLSLDKVTAGGDFKIVIKTDIAETWHINSDKPYDDFLIATDLSIDTSQGFTLSKVIFPTPHDIKLAFSEEPLSVWEGQIYLGAMAKVPADMKPGKYNLIVTLGYQSCNDKTCLAPTSVTDTLIIEVADKQGMINEINQDIFKNVDFSSVSAGAGEINQASNEDGISKTLASSGIFLSLIFVFLGGLALNLTPCVYPLIPITIGYFGGQSEGSTKKLVMMGLLFVLGLSITYSVIGVVTALSGAIFGALLQNPIVIIIIASIFIVLSLSMFGVYEFKLPDSLVAKAGGAKGGMFGAFFMGLTMGIVAAPCIGPFVLGLVTFVAAKADPLFGFLLFFVLAMGLGFPYLLLAIFSGKIKKLPRAGEWMEAVKHIFGFILIGMAIYFIAPILPKSFAGYLLPVFMVFAGVWLIFFDKLANRIKGFRIFKTALSIIIIAAAVYMIMPSQKASIDWQSYDKNIVQASATSTKGTIIDFYADWCIPCKELDALTFSDKRVIDESKTFAAYKADLTKSLSPEVEELRNQYKIVGVPTVLIIDSKGNEVRRITGFVTADEFLKYLKEVN